MIQQASKTDQKTTINKSKNNDEQSKPEQQNYE